MKNVVLPIIFYFLTCGYRKILRNYGLRSTLDFKTPMEYHLSIGRGKRILSRKVSYVVNIYTSAAFSGATHVHFRYSLDEAKWLYIMVSFVAFSRES
jgi:hypothetical protein